MEIGRERNLLVHSDYASYLINKTPEEIYTLYQKAHEFVSIVGVELRACSTGKLQLDDRNRRTNDRQRHELEPPLCGISGPSDPVPSVRF